MSRHYRVIVAAMATLLVVLPAAASPASAATGHPFLYVDGKHGQDNAIGVTWSMDWGRSPEQPFKTIERALEETKHGSPAAIRIRGYDDYIYRETITRGYRMGSESTPVVISSYTADELPDGPFIRPVIDGGRTVGRGGWSRPWASTYPHVWCKTWSPGANVLTGQKVPPGYDTQYDATHEDRLYLDGIQPLHRPASVVTISQLNAQPYSQYWNRKKSTNNLCVHLGLWSGAAIDENPASHDITVPWYFGIVLAGGSSYVTIRDLVIRHTIMGVGFSVSRDRAVGKAHHNSAINVDASYNYRIGFWTAGDYNLFDRVSGTRNSIQLIKLDTGTYADGAAYGARHNTVRDSTFTQNLGHGIKLYGRQVQYNKVYGNTFAAAGIPSKAKASGGSTKGIQVSNGASNNAFWRNRLSGLDRAIELYQYDSQGGPLNANAFHHNWIEKSWTGVFLWDRKVRTEFGKGTNTFSYNVYYDVQRAIGGNGTTSGKLFHHETIYRVGFRKDASTPSVDRSGVYLSKGTITIRDSIVDLTNGPAMCALSGATIKVSHSNAYRWRKDPRGSMPHGVFCKSTSSHSFGTVQVGSGVTYLDPKYVTDPTASDFLVVGPSSPLFSKSTGGTRLGAL